MHQNSRLAHLDLKPENIAITDDLDLALIDFGLAVHHAQPLCRGHGTKTYIAPEVELSRRVQIYYIPEVADIYSLGMCFFAILFDLPSDSLNCPDRIKNRILSMEHAHLSKSEIDQYVPSQEF